MYPGLDFPIRPVPDNDIKKPGMFLFKGWDDYKKNGKVVDAKYNVWNFGCVGKAAYLVGLPEDGANEVWVNDRGGERK